MAAISNLELAKAARLRLNHGPSFMPLVLLIYLTLAVLLGISAPAKPAPPADPLAVLRKVDYLPAFSVDGCHQRATMISIELQAAGIPSSKIVVLSPNGETWIRSPFGPELWSNHAAVLLARDRRSGKWILPGETLLKGAVPKHLELFVLDPLFGMVLLRKEDWLRALKAERGFEVAIEPASLDLEDELGLNASCSALMTHSLFESSSLERIRAKRARIFSRSKALSVFIAKRTRQVFERCEADYVREGQGTGELEALGWKPGRSLVVMVNPRDEARCKIRLGGGGRALFGDEKDDTFSGEGGESYLSARIRQARATPSCYLNEGRLEVGSVRYAFSGSYNDFFLAEGRLVLPGFGDTEEVSFLLDENGDVQAGRIQLPGRSLLSLGIHDERAGRGLPPFRDEFYYGSSTGRGASSWVLGFGDSQSGAFHQFVILQ